MARQFVSFILAITLTSFLIACDCMQHVSGTVVDKETGQPIDSVYIDKRTKGNSTYTDNKGSFTIVAITGGFCLCNPVKVVATKIGYEETTLKIKNGGKDTIYLSRKK